MSVNAPCFGAKYKIPLPKVSDEFTVVMGAHRNLLFSLNGTLIAKPP